MCIIIVAQAVNVLYAALCPLFMSDRVRYLRLNWSKLAVILHFLPQIGCFWGLICNTLDPILSYNPLICLYVPHNTSHQLPCHIGMLSMTQRTKNWEKLRYVGPKTQKFENWETGFALFLNVPEVRWTPELFHPVLWVSTDWNKLLRQKTRKFWRWIKSLNFENADFLKFCMGINEPEAWGGDFSPKEGPNASFEVLAS